MHHDKTPGSKSLVLGLLFTLSLGCGGSQKSADKVPPPQPQPATASTTDAAPAPTKPPAVMLRLDAISNGKGTHELQAGESLRSGDKLAVNVAVDQPAYIYVAFASAAGGAPQFVFPKSGDQQVTPDSPLRIPANPEKWITLDKQTGQEDVFVYASSKPISSTELTNLVNADAAAAKKAAAKKASRPVTAKAKVVKAKGGGDDGLTADNRGIEIEPDDDAPSSNTNPNIVVKKFSVTHK